MVVLASQRDIAALPKVELHVHLNGSISEATASTLARRHGADPATALTLVDGRYPGTYGDFQGFLDAYLAANAFVRTADDLELVAAEFVHGQAAQRVIYSEAIFTPMILVRNGMDPIEMWSALRRGLAAAGPETRVGLVVDAIRDYGAEEAEATLRLVEAADAPIVGLGLTGVEGTVPTEDFVPFRRRPARSASGSRSTPARWVLRRASSTRSTSSTRSASAMASPPSATRRSWIALCERAWCSTSARRRTWRSARSPPSRRIRSPCSGRPASRSPSRAMTRRSSAPP